MGRFLLIGLTFLAALPTRQQFHAATDVVHVPVVVVGRDGRLVRGLTADDFEVREDGRPQRIQFFAEGSPGEVFPLHLGLLLDTSESMQRDLADATTASIQCTCSSFIPTEAIRAAG